MGWRLQERPSRMVKTRVIAHSQQVVRFDREDRTKIDGKILRSLLKYITSEIPKHDAVILSDYKKGVISSELLREVVRSARSGNIFVSVDPKVGHFHLYKNVSLITPNLLEGVSGIWESRSGMRNHC